MCRESLAGAARPARGRSICEKRVFRGIRKMPNSQIYAQTHARTTHAPPAPVPEGRHIAARAAPERQFAAPEGPGRAGPTPTRGRLLFARAGRCNLPRIAGRRRAPGPRPIDLREARLPRHPEHAELANRRRNRLLRTAGYSGAMTSRSFSSGKFLVGLAAVLAVVLAAGFVAVFFFDANLFGANL
jgi:hypothetical protein